MKSNKKVNAKNVGNKLLLRLYLKPEIKDKLTREQRLFCLQDSGFLIEETINLIMEYKYNLKEERGK